MSGVVSRQADVETLRAGIGGDVVAPGDAAYEQARKVFNGMIDRPPAVVVRCASTHDVVAGLLSRATSHTHATDMALSPVDAPWLYFCLSMWMDPSEDERNMGWARLASHGPMANAQL